MEGLCENCIYINKKKKYGNVFNDNFWYGCKKSALGTTKDEYYPSGELHYNDTNPRCYEENLQCKLELNKIDDKIKELEGEKE